MADLAELRIPDEARNNSGGGRRWPLLLLLAAALVVVVILGVVLGARAVEVQVAAPRVESGGGAATLLNASGYVTPRRRATVAAKITARVIEMLADEGMQVEGGQVLARLDDSDARKRLDVARATLDAARANVPVLEVALANADRELRRQEDLDKAGVASQQALDLARTSRDSYKAQLAAAREQVKVAQANLASAQQDVENCTVRAPFAGIVVSKDAQPGEMVSPVSAGSGFTRTGIATVVDMASLEIEVDVNEAYIAKVSPGQPVEATLDAYPDWKIPARVRTVIPTADRQRATVKVRIAFDRLDSRILPDMGVKVAFQAEPAGGAEATGPRVLIPETAVRREDGQAVVFLVKDGKTERRAVGLGNNRGSDVEVVAGLSTNDQVVVAGPRNLRDGQRVKVK